jgi:hypothetical protein
VPDPDVESGEHQVRSVDLIASTGEVGADRAEIVAAADAAPQEPG